VQLQWSADAAWLVQRYAGDDHAMIYEPQLLVTLDDSGITQFLKALGLPM